MQDTTSPAPPGSGAGGDSEKMPPPASPAEQTPPPPPPFAGVKAAAPPPPPQPQPKSPIEIERAEEAKLKAKFPQRAPVPGHLGGGSGGGHSGFLQKRLAKGQKYFDSGDYHMAMDKNKKRGLGGVGGRTGPGGLNILAGGPPTGETIPTPDCVPARKTSIIQPIHDHSQSMHVPADPAHLTPAPGHPMPNPALTKLAS